MADEQIFKFLFEYGKNTAVPNHRFPFLDRNTVDLLSESIVNIFQNSHGRDTTLIQRNSGKAVVELIRSWCKRTKVSDHDLYSECTLEILIDEISKNIKFNTYASADTLNQHIENYLFDYDIKTERKNTSNELIKFIESKKLQNDKDFVYEEPIEILNTSDVLTCLNNKDEKIDKTSNKKSTERSLKREAKFKINKLLELCYALLNIPDTKNSFVLLEKIIYTLLYNDIDSNEVSEFFMHVIENSETYKFPHELKLEILLNRRNLLEQYILNTSLQVITNIKFDNDKNYNQLSDFLEIKSQVYKMINNKEFLSICEISKKSKEIFFGTSLILNEILIRLDYDFRILALIENYIDATICTIELQQSKDENSAVLTYSCILDLYPNEYNNLASSLNFDPEIFQNMTGKGQEIYKMTIQNMHTLYIDEPKIFVLFLSHFKKWFDHINFEHKNTDKNKCTLI